MAFFFSEVKYPPVSLAYAEKGVEMGWVCGGIGGGCERRNQRITTLNLKMI